MKVGDIVVLTERFWSGKATIVRVAPSASTPEQIVVDENQACASAGLGPNWGHLSKRIATLSEEMELAAYIQDHNGKVPAGY